VLFNVMVMLMCSKFIRLIPLSVWAAITSISLSLLATGIDSFFDIGSNVLLFWLHRKAQKLDVRKWPVGGARLGTIGNIVYGSWFTLGILYIC
jgi:divalent metal cation (Fe/Co/Zn/Cd) transporter